MGCTGRGSIRPSGTACRRSRQGPRSPLAGGVGSYRSASRRGRPRRGGAGSHRLGRAPPHQRLHKARGSRPASGDGCGRRSGRRGGGSGARSRQERTSGGTERAGQGRALAAPRGPRPRQEPHGWLRAVPALMRRCQERDDAVSAAISRARICGAHSDARCHDASGPCTCAVRKARRAPGAVDLSRHHVSNTTNSVDTSCHGFQQSREEQNFLQKRPMEFGRTPSVNINPGSGMCRKGVQRASSPLYMRCTRDCARNGDSAWLGTGRQYLHTDPLYALKDTFATEK